MLINRLFRPEKSRPAAPRPRPGARLSVESLDDRIVPASLSVGDATLIEGDASSQYALVNVTLDAPAKKTVTVKYATADGTATAGSDYGVVSGKLTFAPGETGKTIAVPVHGDGEIEVDESFVITLSGAKNARIGDGQGVVAILNDDLPVSPRSVGVSISDAEGTVYLDGATTSWPTLYFTVSLSAASDQVVTINYATTDGQSGGPLEGALAGVDYLATSGTLTFAPGETTKTIAVEVIGPGWGVERWFSVNLSEASGNAEIIDGLGVGTIHYHVVQPPDDGCEWSPYGC